MEELKKATDNNYYEIVIYNYKICLAEIKLYDKDLLLELTLNDENDFIIVKGEFNLDMLNDTIWKYYLSPDMKHIIIYNSDNLRYIMSEDHNSFSDENSLLVCGFIDINTHKKVLIYNFYFNNISFYPLVGREIKFDYMISIGFSNNIAKYSYKELTLNQT